MSIEVIKAKKIVTMNPSRPFASFVAIKCGMILGCGNLDEVSSFGKYHINDEFADKILLPGFVEGHAHSMEGVVWDYPYIGYHDRYDPQGNLWSGLKSMDLVISSLQNSDKILPSSATLFAWGFDPIYFGHERMTTKHLDKVSTSRKIVVLHSNAHLLNVNSVVLEKAGITKESNLHGIIKDSSGSPTGELAEMAAKYLVYKHCGNPFSDSLNCGHLNNYAQSAVNCGVTSVTDLFANFNEKLLANYQKVSKEKDYPIRLVPAMNTLVKNFDEGIKTMKKAMQTSNDRLHYGPCKIMTDGSIQGFSARLLWPCYHNRSPNGIWNMPPSQLKEAVMAYHKAGLQLHIHTNGDEASELMIDAIEDALIKYPRFDHRHTLQHGQMINAAQFRRIAKLGICVNLFANHIYYWGDQHYRTTLGPDRAWRMNACRTAQDLGINFSIHSDAPVTPMAPLFTAWCASNRLTESGMVLGPEECISVPSALRAITLGSAYTLKLDHLIGSIESGKYADFAVLEENPLEVSVSKLKDIKIWGTISGGIAHKATLRKNENQ